MLRSCSLLAALILGASTIPAYAGPMPPCFTATLSAHGRMLVINDLTFTDPDETHVRTIKTSTYRVIPRYVDPNEGLRLNGPNAYWADSLWKVVFVNDQKSGFGACQYTLVTDDGEYLVLVESVFGLGGLSIYRRRDHQGQPFGGPGPDHGVLVRQISGSDLSPSEHASMVYTDHTPAWFAGANFTFSLNDTVLNYKAKDGKSFQVDLATGNIDHK